MYTLFRTFATMGTINILCVGVGLTILFIQNGVRHGVAGNKENGIAKPERR
jgi:hypothetical protein